MTTLVDVPAAPAQTFPSGSTMVAIIAPSTFSGQVETSALLSNSVQSISFTATDAESISITSTASVPAAGLEPVQNFGLSDTIRPPVTGNPSNIPITNADIPVAPRDVESSGVNGGGNAPSGPISSDFTVAVRASITPSVVSQTLDLQAGAFRITRMPADAGRLQVAFVQTAYGPDGAAEQPGGASFVPGAAYVDIPVAWETAPPANTHEIVTLTLRTADDYQIAQPTATMFLANATRGCSEAALLEAFRRGQSTEAFNALFQLHRSSVFQTCFGLLRNLADAEDVCQLVFLALARRPFRLGMSMAGWLHTVARNACIALLRSRSRRLRREARAAKAERVTGEDEAIDLQDEMEFALAQLAPDLRDAVRLRYLEGWSQHQAAERLGCPRGTLSQRAARGIQSLRDILGCKAD